MSRVVTRKAGSLNKLRDTLAKGGGWIITNVPKEGAITVRFLTEPDEWVGYEEVWDPSLRKFYPATEGMDRSDDMSISNRYLAVALDVGNDKVIALKLTRDLANRLVNRFDKYGTLLDRDYELERYGDGLDTTYEATPDAPSRKKLDKYELLDLEDVLQKQWESVFGTDDEDEDEPPRRRNTRPTASRKTQVVDDEDDDEIEDEDDDLEDDDDEEFEIIEDDEDDEDDDDFEDDDEEEDEEMVEYSEEELAEMTMKELRDVAKEFGIKTARLSKEEVAELILEAQYEDLEDEDDED